MPKQRRSRGQSRVVGEAAESGCEVISPFLSPTSDVLQRRPEKEHQTQHKQANSVLYVFPSDLHFPFSVYFLLRLQVVDGAVEEVAASLGG